MRINNKAIGACALMMVHLSFVSNTAVGTMLKFAAIGVHNVPQYPHVIPKAPTTLASPP